MLGDFNAWNPLWGSIYTNQSEKIWEDGFPTHFSTHNTFTYVDLSFSKSAVAPSLNRQTLN